MKFFMQADTCFSVKASNSKFFYLDFVLESFVL